MKNASLLFSAIFVLLSDLAYAGSATWKLTPSSGDWNTAGNWTPATVPSSSSDTATFDVSNTTAVSLSASVTINGILFNPGASPFSISPAPNGTILTFSGLGITNNSGITQNFVATGTSTARGLMIFSSTASAGNGTVFTVQPGAPFGGLVEFDGTSTAGAATIDVEGGTTTDNQGNLWFYNSSSAGSATITGHHGTTSLGGAIYFYNTATAGNANFVVEGGASGEVESEQSFVSFQADSRAENATITVNGATSVGTYDGRASLGFADRTTADNATLIANGGSNGGSGGLIEFTEFAKGGTPRVELFGNGRLLIAYHVGTPLVIGSLEGDGQVILGANNLTVGANSLTTRFAGIIEDNDGSGDVGGSLTKTGNGALTLTGPNTYTGGTLVNGGTLLVNNRNGSATGTGIVTVREGILGGSGTVAGAVNVGIGTGVGAFLAPSIGAGRPASATIQGVLTFQADGTYTCKLNTRRAVADQVTANGVTINNGAQFALQAVGNRALTVGQVFTAISNSSTTSISGTFANLPDGSNITIGRNTFRADYDGGDGNDLTLTVL